jgi:hypothetical protein
LQVPLERAESRCPSRSIWLQPCVELHQRFGTQSVQPALGVTPDLHQPGVTQHLEVAGHPRLVHPDLLDQLADGPLTVADSIKDSPPRRFSDHLEDCDLQWHKEMIRQNIYTCNRMYERLNRADSPAPPLVSRFFAGVHR